MHLSHIVRVTIAPPNTYRYCIKSNYNSTSWDNASSVRQPRALLTEYDDSSTAFGFWTIQRRRWLIGVFFIHTMVNMLLSSDLTRGTSFGIALRHTNTGYLDMNSPSQDLLGNQQISEKYAGLSPLPPPCKRQMGS